MTTDQKREDIPESDIPEATGAAEVASKRYCRFHKNCKNTSEEHRKHFICVYQKPCKFGSRCKLRDEERHNLYFSHPDPSAEDDDDEESTTKVLPMCKFGAKCRLITSKMHLSRYAHPIVEEDSEDAPQTRLTRDSSHYVTATFNFHGVDVNGKEHVISSTFRKRVFKNLSHPEVEAIFTRSILARYIRGITFKEQHLDLDVQIPLEEDIDASASPKLPIPHSDTVTDPKLKAMVNLAALPLPVNLPAVKKQ